MRKLIILFVTLATITSCDLKRENFNSSKKHFTNEVLLGYTPVKDQGHSSLCWAYACSPPSRPNIYRWATR